MIDLLEVLVSLSLPVGFGEVIGRGFSAGEAALGLDGLVD
jgi:hypothetical protein